MRRANAEGARGGQEMRESRKDFTQRREELRQGLCRLEGAISRYKATGEVAELGTVAVELRGLLLAKGRLLISLAEEKKFSLQVFTSPTALMDVVSGRSPGNATHTWAGDSVSLVCIPPWTRPVTIPEWLGETTAKIEGRCLTAQELISQVANTLGPAHYSPEMSAPLAEMAKFSLGGVPSHYYTLFRFAEVLLDIGNRFLASY